MRIFAIIGGAVKAEKRPFAKQFLAAPAQPG
jgi:hypothetical protein